MADHSKIEWTDATWSPIRARVPRVANPRLGYGAVGWHCEHVSEGCRNCYAEGINRRLGTGLDFKPGHRKDIEIFVDEKMLLAPLKWKKPRMIFVCSMTDLFADFVTDEMILRVLDVIRRCSFDGGSNCGRIAGEHKFQVLTKRSARMAAFMPRLRFRDDLPFGECALFLGDDAKRPTVMRNLWLGVSVEDQANWDGRKEHLRNTPAAVRFASFEPLLGPIVDDDFSRTIQWAIVGGESGKGARPMHPDWARSIRDQCQAAGVPFFMKQWGEWMPLSQCKEELLHGAHGVISRDGRFRFDHDIADPPDHMFTIRLGKKAAGRLLDGELHDGMPG